MKRIAIEYQKYLAFLLSKPSYFIQFEMRYPVVIFNKAMPYFEQNSSYMTSQKVNKCNELEIDNIMVQYTKILNFCVK